MHFKLGIPIICLERKTFLKADNPEIIVCKVMPLFPLQLLLQCDKSVEVQLNISYILKYFCTFLWYDNQAQDSFSFIISAYKFLWLHISECNEAVKAVFKNQQPINYWKKKFGKKRTIT
jgi:hypothetical protein